MYVNSGHASEQTGLGRGLILFFKMWAPTLSDLAFHSTNLGTDASCTQSLSLDGTVPLYCVLQGYL